MTSEDHQSRPTRPSLPILAATWAAEDMPATTRRAYLAALAPERRATELHTLPSYGPALASDWSERVDPRLEQTLEELRRARIRRLTRALGRRRPRSFLPGAR